MTTEIGGPDDVMGMKDGDGFIIFVDGIGVMRVPAIVNDKWPTLKDAVLQATKEWWRQEWERTHPSAGERQQG